MIVTVHLEWTRNLLRPVHNMENIFNGFEKMKRNKYYMERLPEFCLRLESSHPQINGPWDKNLGTSSLLGGDHRKHCEGTGKGRTPTQHPKVGNWGANLLPPLLTSAGVGQYQVTSLNGSDQPCTSWAKSPLLGIFAWLWFIVLTWS